MDPINPQNEASVPVHEPVAIAQEEQGQDVTSGFGAQELLEPEARLTTESEQLVPDLMTHGVVEEVVSAPAQEVSHQIIDYDLIASLDTVEKEDPITEGQLEEVPSLILKDLLDEDLPQVIVEDVVLQSSGIPQIVEPESTSAEVETSVPAAVTVEVTGKNPAQASEQIPSNMSSTTAVKGSKTTVSKAKVGQPAASPAPQARHQHHHGKKLFKPVVSLAQKSGVSRSKSSTPPAGKKQNKVPPTPRGTPGQVTPPVKTQQNSVAPKGQAKQKEVDVGQPQNLGSMNSPQIQTQVTPPETGNGLTPLPIEIPDSVTDEAAFRTYLSTRRGAMIQARPLVVFGSVENAGDDEEFPSSENPPI